MIKLSFNKNFQFILGMENLKVKTSELTEFLSQIKWWAVIVVTFLHCGAIYGIYLGIVSGKWQTILLGYVFGRCIHLFFKKLF